MTRLGSLVRTVIAGAALVREQQTTIVNLTAALNESHERETVLVEASVCRNLSVHLDLAARLQRAQTDLAIATRSEPHAASLKLAP